MQYQKEPSMRDDPASLDSFTAKAQHALKHEAEVKQLIHNNNDHNKSAILVGRDDELEILQSAFAIDDNNQHLRHQQQQPNSNSSNQRTTRVMCIWGEAGCGKSTLVKAARARSIKTSRTKNATVLFGSTSDSGPYICYGKYTLDGRGDSGLARCVKDLVRQIVDRDWDMGIRRRLQESFTESDADVLIETFPALSILFDTREEDYSTTEEGTISEVDKTRRGKRRQFLFLQLFQQLTIHKANQYRDEDIPEDRPVEDKHLATRPIIMVLDDVQWACHASMDIITALVGNLRLEHFRLIVTSRPTEPSATADKAAPCHQEHRHFQDAMKQWKKVENNIAVDEMHLQNFDVQHVHQLVAKILDTDPATIAPLGSIIFQKTKGHPLYTTEFLKTLVNQRMVKYNFGELEWTYDIPLIEKTWDANISTNTRNAVIQLFQDKLQALPSQQHRTILQVAACLGASFTTSFFDQIYHCVSSASPSDATALLDSSKQLDTLLSDCVDLGLLLASSSEGAAADQTSFMFVHDLAREATLMKNTNDDGNREDIQWLKMKVGKRLIHLADVHRKRREQKSLLFLGVDLCNEACSSENPTMTKRDGSNLDSSFLVNLAGHNLLAGRKAVRGSSYDRALQYNEAGLRHLEAVGDADSQLSLHLLSGAAEAAYCLGDFEKMQVYSDQVTKRNGCPISTQINMSVFQILSTTTRRQHERGLTLGRMALEALGMPKVPANPSVFHVMVELIKTKRLLKNHSRETLLELPLLTDTNRISAMRVVEICMTPAFIANRNFFLVTFLRSLRWSVKYGICQYSPPLFATYGMIQMTAFGDGEALRTYSDVSLKLAERIGYKETISRVSLICFSYCRHWVSDMRSSIPPLVYSTRLALEVGDTETGLQCTLHKHFLDWCTSASSILQLAEELRESVAKTNEIGHLGMMAAFLYLAKGLRKLCGADIECFAWLDNESIGTIQHEVDAQEQDRGIQHFYDAVDLQTGFLLGHYDDTLKLAERTDGIGTKVTPGTPYAVQTQFYRGMVFLSYADTQDCNKSKKKLLKRSRSAVTVLRKWKEIGCVSCTHRLHLLEAEEARVTGKTELATDHYTAAIQLATRTIHEQDVALGHECAARFYLENGDKSRAAHHLEQSARSYVAWGANAKSKLLTKPYTELLSYHGSTVHSFRKAENNSTAATSSTRLLIQ